MMDDPLLKPGQVAELFCVNVKTVTRWAQTGRLRSERTLGGHRRFRTSAIKEALGKVGEKYGVDRPEGEDVPT